MPISFALHCRSVDKGGDGEGRFAVVKELAEGKCGL